MGGSAAYINGIACAASMIDADGCQAPSRPSLKPLIGSPAFALTTIVLLSKCYGSDPRLASRDYSPLLGRTRFGEGGVRMASGL